MVAFTCNDCPVTRAYEGRLIALLEAYKDNKVQIIAVSANDPERQPHDCFENMQKPAESRKFGFPQ